MRFLVVGGGSREHAIAWRLSASALVTELFIAPGNAGTAQLGRNVPIGAEDIESLLRFARASSVDVTVVGPEAPLAAGIADRFAEADMDAVRPHQSGGANRRQQELCQGADAPLRCPHRLGGALR